MKYQWRKTHKGQDLAAGGGGEERGTVLVIMVVLVVMALVTNCYGLGLSLEHNMH